MHGQEDRDLGLRREFAGFAGVASSATKTHAITAREGVTCSCKPCIAPLPAAGLLGCASSQPRPGGGLARPQSGSKLRPDICAELEEPRGLSLPPSATPSMLSSDLAPSDFLGLAADTERAGDAERVRAQASGCHVPWRRRRRKEENITGH